MNLRSVLFAVCGALIAGLVLGAWSASAETTKEWLVTSNGDVGQGTLRWAIEGANESAVDDVIRFASEMTVRPTSPLPPLTGADIAIIGSSGEHSADVVPRVWIDGDLAGDAAGLELIASGGMVRGLGIVGFQRYGIGVVGVDATGARIIGNWIGLRPNGSAAANRLSGVAVIAGARGAQIRDNRIGGNSDPGRTGHGIVVGGGGSIGSLIEGNVIGIALDGSAAPNDDGILIVDSGHAVILGNTIGFSRVAGIEVRQSRLATQLDGNRIGIRRDGAAAPNDVGVFLGVDSAGVRVGSEQLNVIAANRVGIAVEQGAREALILNNWIGLVPPRGVVAPRPPDLVRALIRPNRERGISIIAGAAEIRVSNNYVSAGEFGIVIADASTARVSLTRNVVAGSRQGHTTAGIDVRAGAEIVIGGGDSQLGNHVCGAEFGIRIGDTEEPQVGSNAVGAGAATRVTFDSDHEMTWGVRLEDRVVSARVQRNHISDAKAAGISVVGQDAQDNLLSLNRYARNGRDIDLGADGRSVNDAGDRDRGPNGLLNHPTIVAHDVRSVSAVQVGSTFRGVATPGSYVEIYEWKDSSWDRIARSQRADRLGNWKAQTLVLPDAPIRALAMMSSGSTSEFSPPFLASQRLKLQPGVNQIAWTGPEMSIEEAMSPIRRWVRTVWRWSALDSRWEGWSPLAPAEQAGRRGSLERVRTGDVLRVELSARLDQDFFVPAGGAVSETFTIAVARGFNQVAWMGGKVSGLETLSSLDTRNPGLIGSVWQWDGLRWQLVWPRLLGAWDPMQWGFETFWLRAIRSGELQAP